MPVDRLFVWWNAVYTVPLAFVLILLTLTSVVSMLGGAFGELAHGDAHSDIDHDVDVDHDVDLDHDVDVDAHVDAGIGAHAGVHHDTGVDADSDLDADLDGDGQVTPVERAMVVGRAHAQGSAPGGDHGLLVGALVALGVGRAPLLMLLQILVLFWGLIGIGLHQAFAAHGPQSLAWSVPATLTLSVLGTRTFALLFGRFFKQKESYAVGRSEIVGRTGRVVFAVTADEGTIHVRDRHGTLHRVRARCPHGRLESGREIIILGYDPEQKLYQVDDSVSFVDRA